MSKLNTKIFITGANGFVGQAFCFEALARCMKVRGAVRQTAELPAEIEHAIIGDIDESTDWSSALTGCDVVVHLAARVHVMNDSASDPLAEFRKINVEGTLNLASQAAKSGVKRFFFISSVKVNGESTLPHSPFKEDDISNPQDAYGISKHEAERGLLEIAHETGMEVVIIRPPLVYGAGVKANFASMIKAVNSGLPMPFGAIHNQRSLIYVGNLVDFILKCVSHPAAANQIFLVSDGVDVSTTALLQACAKALDVKPRLIPVPQKILALVFKLLGRKNLAQRLCGNLQVDISKARQLLDWTPPYSMDEGLKATVLPLIKK